MHIHQGYCTVRIVRSHEYYYTCILQSHLSCKLITTLINDSNSIRLKSAIITLHGHVYSVHLMSTSNDTGWKDCDHVCWLFSSQQRSTQSHTNFLTSVLQTPEPQSMYKLCFGLFMQLWQHTQQFLRLRQITRVKIRSFRYQQRGSPRRHNFSSVLYPYLLFS